METRAPRQRDARQREDPASGGPLIEHSDEWAQVEHSVEIETTRERVYAVLTDPNNIVRYAGGIEGAEVIEKPSEGFRGAKLEVVTKGGNIRRATVIRADHDCIEVKDDRGIRVRWETEDIGPGKVRVRNVIEGPIATRSVNQLRYDVDVKFQALQHILEEDDPMAGAG